MIVVENEYDFGDIVYLKTDNEQLPRMITSIEVFKNGELLYKLACGTVTTPHYEYEISSQKDVVGIL